MDFPVHLSKIQEKSRSGSNFQSSCEIIDSPTAKKLYRYVVGNKPFIIRGVADKWPAIQKWTDEYLLQTLRGKQVVVSVTPTGDFDGPEPKELWDSTLPETYVIARPAHINIKFEKFMEFLNTSRTEPLLRINHSGPVHSRDQQLRRQSTGSCTNVTTIRDASFYLEYFPLAVLGDSLFADIPPMLWANFLIKRTNLLWMGGGARTTVGRLHFDRNENMMAMVRGSKTFVLFDPGQSAFLYGDVPLRSASLDVSFEDGDRLVFHRRASAVGEAVPVHTYSPVDLTRPNYTEHPLLRNAKGFECTVSAGDILFVPSHWWHQVISHDDEHGKSIGVNTFYEPFYHRPAYKCVPPYMQYNRHYSHIREMESVRPCAREHVCFASDESSGTRKRAGSTSKSSARKKSKAKKTSKKKGVRSK